MGGGCWRRQAYARPAAVGGTASTHAHFCLVVGAMAGLPRYSAGGWEVGFAVGLVGRAAGAADKYAIDAKCAELGATGAAPVACSMGNQVAVMRAACLPAQL